eukprot:TRINITY_DN3732_c0_g2_i1.p1 TRINITY_DN3732_c0_g2~~TRINITY_DN3732_c0_g2_i1.p1  ORF type:complete len:420 (+),score=133.15 TRINITY_DN3732_c0_g2_i1:84-1343(+)
MTATKHHFIVQPRKTVFADDEEEERRRLEAVLKTAPKKHKVIRGRCREMLKAEWVSLAELWYRQTSEHNQAMFRKVFREIHAVTEAEVETLRSAASLSFERARSFRLAKVMLKLYFSVILRPEYYKKALYWGYAHGRAGELLARTIFGGIESLTSLKFSHYTQTFGKPDDAFLGGLSRRGSDAVVPSGPSLERPASGPITVQMLDGWVGDHWVGDHEGAAAAAPAPSPKRLSDAWDPQALRYNAMDGPAPAAKRQIEPLDVPPRAAQKAVAFKQQAASNGSGSQVSSCVTRRKMRSRLWSPSLQEVAHWKPADAESQGKGLRGPSWVVEGVQKNWSTTNRDHFSPKPLPQSLRPRPVEDGAASPHQPSGIFCGAEVTLTKGFIAPAITASSGGCLPRTTLTPQPRAASASPMPSPTPTT